jgi:hypothetical protein
VYFHLGATNGLRCQLTDQTGKVVQESGFGFGGGAPNSQWVDIPSDGSVRLRVSVFGGGRLEDGGLGQRRLKVTDDDYQFSGGLG